MSTLAERIQSLSPEQRALFELQLKEKKLKMPVSEVPRVAREGDLLLSFAQQRLWLLQQLFPESPVYNTFLSIRLSGSLNVQALKRVIDEIVRRHEVLHTTFPVEDGQPVQRPNPALCPEFRTLDLQHLPEAERDNRAHELLLEELRTPFNLKVELPLRPLVVVLSPEQRILLLTIHHIASDRWSIDVLASELGEIYEAYAHHRPLKLAELTIQYADFAMWQRQRIKGDLLQQHLSYWKRQLEDLAPLDLPVDRRSPDFTSWDGGRAYLRLGPQVAESLSQIAQQQGATLFMTMLALFEVLLYRYSGIDDLAIGTPITNRSNPQTRGLIGCFVNTLVLRNSLSGNPIFAELLQRVKQTCLDAYTWQELPFERLVEELQPQRNLDYSPLFRTMFTLNDQHEPLRGRNLLETVLDASGLQLCPFEVDHGAIATDLLLRVEKLSAETLCVFEYRRQLFRHDTIVRMLGHFRMLLDAVIADPAQRIGDLPLLTEAEENKILIEWNNCQAKWKDKRSALERIAEHARRSPAAPAVSGGGKVLSYGELNRKANQWTRVLARLNVTNETVVGVWLARSPEMVAALLAIWKAGAAYLPIGQSPTERVNWMLANAGATVLITDSDRIPLITEWQGIQLTLNELEHAAQGEPETDPESSVYPQSLAYVIYTSGSTGQPKGVMIQHGSLLNLLEWHVREYGIQPDDRASHLAEMGFDGSVWELWPYLISGASVHMADEEVRLSPVRLLHWLIDQQISIGFVPTPLLEAMLKHPWPEGSKVRALLTGGDKLHRVAFPEGKFQLFNHYGPTENTVVATSAAVDSVALLEPAIGRPIANSEAYVMDEGMRPVPIGVVGELYVGGEGLARGYLGHPEMTAERFVPHPYSKSGGARLYRTGDWARYRENGELEFAGRKDGQVKIRGFRIELGEIEAALLQHPEVREAAVLARGDEGTSKRIVAYIVAGEKERVNELELQERLRRKLPEYMMPSGWVWVEKLPLTPNGKLDRKALESYEERGREAEQHVAPRNITEQKIAELWQELLGLERVGVHANFFELGGHSLVAAQMVSRLGDLFSVDLPLRTVFENATVARLAQLLPAVKPKAARVPAIRASANRGIAPLSYAQQRLWIVANLEPENAAYNVPFALRLKGRLNVNALQESLREILRRHEILRAIFPERDGQPIQQITDLEPAFSAVDISCAASSERQDSIGKLIEEEARTPFDVRRGPLFRGKLIVVEPQEEHILLVTMHHIVSDGWSIGILLREFSSLYRAFCKGAPSPLADPEIQYADYAQWQREWLQGDVLQEHLEYWRSRLKALSILNVPLDYPRPPIPSYKGESLRFTVPSPITHKLQALVQQESVSPFIILAAAFQLLLSRYCQQDDVVVGADIACRDRAETEGLVGFFVNQLVLRAKITARQSFRQLLGEVKDGILESYAYQNIPFEKLVEEFAPAHELDRHPLFQCKIAMEHAIGQGLELPELQINLLEGTYQFIKTDMRLVMHEAPALCSGRLEYATDLFSRETMQRFAQRWLVLLDRIANSPDQPLTELSLLTESERQRLLIERNATSFEFPAESVIEQFERQARVAPNRIAAVFEERKLTFAELDAQANQLARYLRQSGVGPESLVGLCMERCLEMVVGLLGVLKAGGAYIPLDFKLPAERIQWMLEDACPLVLLTKTYLLSKFSGLKTRTVCLDDEWPQISALPATTPDRNLQLQNLAYVLYTSGSTGRPKGVMIEHASLANYVQAIIRRAELQPEFSYAMVQPLNVDSCITVLFPSLCAGGALHLISEEVAMNGLALADYLDRHGIDCIKIAPTHLIALQGSSSSSLAMPQRRLILGGEGSNYSWAMSLAKNNPKCLVFNHYGPTETTVGVLTYKVDVNNTEAKLKTTPLEKPLANTQAYILDEDGQPVPEGFPGELHIGGRNVARGYLKRPALTAEKFIPDPFSTIAGSRLYRTGDLVRLSPEGLIEYLGRLDHQVKIRGFRVELQEIEATLLRHPNVAEAVLVSRESKNSDKQLVAYFVARQQPAPSRAELRDFMGRHLPQYMMPAAFVSLNEMPRLSHGKLDRNALPAFEADASLDGDFVPPRSPAEELLAGVWRKLLGQERISVYDNFFDLGGNSLIAIQAISQIRQLFRVELPFRVIFSAPILANLARIVEEAQRQAKGVQRPPIIPVPRTQVLPLSFAQKRLWFVDSLAPDDPAYLVPIAMRITGELVITALQKSFDELIRRHEVLRTIFPVENHAPVQVISAEASLPMMVRDLRVFPPAEREREAHEVITRASREPFDLSHGPLIRVQLLQISDREHVLVLALHHIISDGWSSGILIQELAALYDAFAAGSDSPLPPVLLQYADFAAWQASWLQGEELERLLGYWTKKLANSVPLQFPVDYFLAKEYSNTFGCCFHNLGRPLSQKLKQLARQEEATDFMVLLAGFAAVLIRYTGQQDLTIGTPVAGRTHAELEQLLGCFVNALVLRIQADGNPDFQELIRNVKETTIGAYEHQELPFEKLVEELQPARTMARSTIFDVMFVLQNVPRRIVKLPNLEMTQMEVEPATAKFNLILTIIETEEGFKARLEYNQSYFAPATMRRFLNHFERMLRGLADHPNQRLAQVQLLDESERQQALVDWNRTATAYPADIPVHKVFEAIAERYPSAVALEFEDERVTYRDLNERANQLASYLHSVGVRSEYRVAICLERSPKLIVAILATLKAGAAYLPLDASYPEERLAFMLEDAGAGALITESSLADRLPRSMAEVIDLDTDWPKVAEQSCANFQTEVHAESLAYVMYTSGSTGTPKGVAVTHRSIVRLVKENSFTSFTPDEVFFQFAPVSFDASTFEIWGALLNGAKLVICSAQDPSLSELGEILQQRRVTTLWLTAGLFRLMVGEQLSGLSGLRQLLAGGDVLSVPHVQRVTEELSCRLINGYGPTENTTFSCCHTVSREDHLRGSIPIGRPIANSEAYVLDEEMQPAPVGVIGELYVGGAGLARGYMGRPELTAEKFVPHPYSQKSGARLYRTGDWARYRENGELEFTGRRDGQVKIRGFRVELGEIEAALLEHPGVKEAVALVRGVEEEKKKIVAYVVANEPEGLSGAELREYVKTKLPEYMMPGGWIMLEALPLTANGKLDREALGTYEEETEQREEEYVAPRTEIEQKVAELWQEVLGLEQVSIHANFFDLGGHSLVAAQLVSRLQQAFSVRIPLRLVFDSPTVAELAEGIEVLLWMAEQEQLPQS